MQLNKVQKLKFMMLKFYTWYCKSLWVIMFEQCFLINVDYDGISVNN